MSTKRIKLSVFAKEQGVAYITAYRHWQQGNIEGVQLPSGSILVSGWKDGNPPETDTTNAVIYARVPNAGMKTELRNQVARLTKHVESKNYNLIETVEEVAVGFSDHRTKLLSLLYRPDWDILVIDRRESLMKFGFPYVEALLRKNHQEIIILSEIENDDTPGQPELPHVPLNGEQQLITLIQKIRTVLKTLIGIGTVKTQLEQQIQNLLD